MTDRLASAVRLLAALAALLLTPACARAQDFGQGPLPITFEPQRPVALDPTGHVDIAGTIDGTQPVMLVLRVDDGRSTDYQTRMNDERTLQPGPFALSFDVAALRATDGRNLDAKDIRRVILFIVGPGTGQIWHFAFAPRRGAAPAATAASSPVPAGAAATAAGAAIDFGKGSLPVAFEPQRPVALPAGGRIEISGVVAPGANANVTLRIDDTQTPDYASRMNDERSLPPGPFDLAYDVGALKTTGGRALDPSRIYRVILFGEGKAQVTSFRVVAVAGAPASTPPPTPAAPRAPAAPSTVGAAATAAGAAIDFGKGSLPVAFEPQRPVAFPAGGRIEISGIVAPGANANVTLRIDDTQTPDYASRMNDERSLPPGPFDLAYDVGALKTTGGRALDPSRIYRVILFGEGNARVTKFRVVASAAEVPVSPAVIPTSARSPNAPASAPRSFGSGTLPIKFEPRSPVTFPAADEIRVEGVNAESVAAGVAVRVDDKGSTSYQTRYNDERMVPPGPFKFAIGLQGLRTISGRNLDPAAITRIILFPWKDKANVTITRFETAPSAAMPEGVHGYAFGAPDAPLLAGFERIVPTDTRIQGRGQVQSFRRPAPDPLIANGVKNIRAVTLPAPSPRVRVTVWSEDPGEWELLPHPFVRRIQVNGKDAVNEKWSADDWIARRYMQGGSLEHTASDDAWTAYGVLRGNAASVDVDAVRDGVTIELSGGDMSAYVLNAVLIEPLDQVRTAARQSAGQSAGQSFVAARRADWYRNTMPVSPAPATDDAATHVALSFAPGARGTVPPLKAVIAADTGGALLFDVTSDATVVHPKITLTAPALGPAPGSNRLSPRLWAAQWKLERVDTTLQLRDDRLLADTASLPLAPSRPRGYELWIDVPKSAPPGLYVGKIEIASGAAAHVLPLEITVPAVTLPPTAKPAGFYLDRAPHLAYFQGLAIERERQVDCDLDLMRSLGLANTAPPIGGLARNDLGAFASDMRRAVARGVAPGWLIYNPLHELIETQGLARAADTVGRLEQLIAAQALPEPVWSLADEPSNADQGGDQLPERVRQFRAAAPHIHLAAHLNNPADDRFVPLFDTAIVNEGFGIDLARLQRLAVTGKGVWLYNTFKPRQTAGLWLWLSAAQRYVQWHARMPTADPFDPIDGREADFQVIYPTAQVCPRQPDIHRDLLGMAEGIVDQRWLLWLDQQKSPDAVRLARDLRTSSSGRFADVARLSRAALEATRARIVGLTSK